MGNTTTSTKNKEEEKMEARDRRTARDQEYQKSTDPIIPKAPFSQLVREIMEM